MNITPRQAEPKQGWVRADLVIAPMQAKSAAEAIAQLAACLQAGGFVKASWAQATIEREKTFATGLPTPEVGVAIPHTDIEHVLQQAIAVGILAEPVLFGEMGNPESTVPVRLVHRGISNRQVQAERALPLKVHLKGLAIERL